MSWKKNLTQEEKVAYHEKKQGEMQDLFKRIDEGVRAVFESERYKEYLNVMAKFTNYSARNCMLIALQKPDATLVAAYGKWKQLGRQVEKGQTGIRVLAPMPYKIRNEEQDEEQEEEDRIAFKVISVFDVSQTSGKELPTLINELDGEISSEQKKAVFRAVQKAVGIPVEFEEIQSGAKGCYSASEKRIVIKSGMSDVQTLKTLLHEAGHALLHNPDLEIATVNSSRNEKEIQAESIAFIVATKLKIADTSEYSFPYIASWSQGKPLGTLNKFLSEIQSAARTLTDAIETELHSLNEEQSESEEENPVFSAISM